MPIQASQAPAFATDLSSDHKVGGSTSPSAQVLLWFSSQELQLQALYLQELLEAVFT